VKCIAYISKVSDSHSGIVLPKGMAEIFSHARKRNSELDITGILSFKRGHYIQVLEGSAGAVDDVFAKIKNDARHTNVNVILDEPISERFFGTWSMRLLQSLNKDLAFLTFFDNFNSKFVALSPEKQQLLKLFYSNGESRSKKVLGLMHFNGETLSLTAWPDQNLLKYTPELINLVAQLTMRQHSYRDLVDSHEFGTRYELDQALNELNGLGLLQIHATPTTIVPVSRQSDSKSGFYNKMRKFLRMS